MQKTMIHSFLAFWGLPKKLAIWGFEDVIHDLNIALEAFLV